MCNNHWVLSLTLYFLRSMKVVLVLSEVGCIHGMEIVLNFHFSGFLSDWVNIWRDMYNPSKGGMLHYSQDITDEIHGSEQIGLYFLFVSYSCVLTQINMFSKGKHFSKSSRRTKCIIAYVHLCCLRNAIMACELMSNKHDICFILGLDHYLVFLM